MMGKNKKKPKALDIILIVVVVLFIILVLYTYVLRNIIETGEKAVDIEDEKISLEEEISKLKTKIEGLWKSDIEFGYYIDKIRFANGYFDTDLGVTKVYSSDNNPYLSGYYKVISGSEIELWIGTNKIGAVELQNDITISVKIIDTAINSYGYGEYYTFRAYK